MTPQHQAIAHKLDEIEAELKSQSLWQERELRPGEYPTNGTFEEPIQPGWGHGSLPPKQWAIRGGVGMGNLSGEKWLQFLVIPRVRRALEDEGEAPRSSYIIEWARKEFSDLRHADDLLKLLDEFDALVNGREPAPAPRRSKYGFKTAEDKEREEETAKVEKAKPVLAAWEERMSALLQEQQALKQLADEIAPKVEDVLRDWVATNKGSLDDPFVMVDPFVARSENGANWAVFLHEDEEAFVGYLWCISLTLDVAKSGDLLMLAVDSAGGVIKDEAEGMAEVLGNITGIPARQLYDYGSIAPCIG